MNLTSTKTQRGSGRDTGRGIRAACSLPASVGELGEHPMVGGRVTGFLPLGIWTDTSQPLPTLDLSDISSKFRRVNSILEPVFSTIQ